MEPGFAVHCSFSFPLPPLSDTNKKQSGGVPLGAPFATLQSPTEISNDGPFPDAGGCLPRTSVPFAGVFISFAAGAGAAGAAVACAERNSARPRESIRQVPSRG